MKDGRKEGKKRKKKVKKKMIAATGRLVLNHGQDKRNRSSCPVG